MIYSSLVFELSNKYPREVAVILVPLALIKAISPTIICLDTLNCFAKVVADIGFSLFLIISIILYL